MIMMHKGRQQSRNMRHIIKQRGRLVRSSQRGSDQWQRTGWGHSVVCAGLISVWRHREYTMYVLMQRGLIIKKRLQRGAR